MFENKEMASRNPFNLFRLDIFIRNYKLSTLIASLWLGRFHVLFLIVFGGRMKSFQTALKNFNNIIVIAKQATHSLLLRCEVSRPNIMFNNTLPNFCFFFFSLDFCSCNKYSKLNVHKPENCKHKMLHSKTESIKFLMVLWNASQNQMFGYKSVWHRWWLTILPAIVINLGPAQR